MAAMSLMLALLAACEPTCITPVHRLPPPAVAGTRAVAGGGWVTITRDGTVSWCRCQPHMKPAAPRAR
jgi:hypothetical protein